MNLVSKLTFQVDRSAIDKTLNNLDNVEIKVKVDDSEIKAADSEKQKLAKDEGFKVKVDDSQVKSAEKEKSKLSKDETFKLKVQDNLSNLKNKISDTFKGLDSGAISDKFQSSLQGISSKFGELSPVAAKAGEAIVQFGSKLGPYGAAAAALGAAIIGSTTALASFNNELAKNNAEVQRYFSNLSGGELNNFSASVKATAKTFGVEFNDVLKSANALSKNFGITGEEALKQVQDGLVKAGSDGEEFLEQIREYSSTLKGTGLDAEQLGSTINQAFSEGQFNDKVVDGLKEANIQLKDLARGANDELKKALTGAGIDADDFAKRILNGSLSSKDAIVQISQTVQKFGSDSKVSGDLVAATFKTMGEDARGAIDIYANINSEQSKLNANLTEGQKAQKRSLEVAQEQEKVLADIFAFDNANIFSEIGTELQALGVNILKFLAPALKGLVVSIEFLVNGFKAAVSFANDLFEAFTKIATLDFSSNDEIKKTAPILKEQTVLTNTLADANKNLEDSTEDVSSAFEKFQTALADTQKKLDEAVFNKNQAEVKKLSSEMIELKKREAEFVKQREQVDKQILQSAGLWRNQSDAVQLLAKSLTDAENRIKLLTLANKQGSASWITAANAYVEAKRANDDFNSSANRTIEILDSQALFLRGVQIEASKTQDTFAGLTKDFIKQNQTLLAENVKTKQLANDQIIKSDNQVTEQQQKSIDLLYAQTEAFGNFLSSSEQSLTDFTNGAALALIDFVQSSLPAWIAAIFGQSVSSAGPIVGTALAFSLIGVLKGLVGNIGGAETGEDNIGTSKVGKRGKTDKHLRWVADKEAIIKASSAEKYRPLLSLMNRGDDKAISNYFVNESGQLQLPTYKLAPEVSQHTNTVKYINQSNIDYDRLAGLINDREIRVNTNINQDVNLKSTKVKIKGKDLETLIKKANKRGR